SNPSWFTPRRLLVVFCFINMLNSVDRGTIASNGVNGRQESCSETGVCSPARGIQGDFNLSNFEDGVISSAFLVGLLVSSPIFASLAKGVNPFRLIGIGLTIWTLSVAFCGLSFNFWSIALCRMLVGIGEASFASLAAPFIDDNAPISQRTAWLGLFYMCIPSGYAIGYIFGGLIGQFGWRWAFFVEALLMFPFAVLCFFTKPVALKGCFSSSTLTILVNDIKIVLLDSVYLVNVLGSSLYTFVLGAYSYWGPKAGYSIYHMKNADYLFGGVTVVCGVLGTLGGAVVLDRIDSTIFNAFKVLSFSTFCGAIFCFSAFCFKSLYVFLALFAVGELLIFATQGPVNFVCLRCVRPSLRPLAMAIATVCIHVLGDVPSSPLVGLLQDHVNNWRETSLITTSVLFITAATWFIG
ncbi:major facilitator protein, partial [Genlisea aurea]